MTQLVITLYGDRTGSTAERIPVSWDDLCAQFAAPPVYPDKAQAQLFTLSEPGETRTDNGSLRSNDNVSRVWGACGDYDGEVIPATQARDAIAAAGFRALVYSSPSNKPDAPRWRVVVPFDTPGTPEDHRATIEKLNAVVGGGLSSESFTLSQPYYVGRVAGSEAAYEAYKIDGVDIRALDMPRQPWRGSERTEGGYRVDSETLLDDLRGGIEIHPAIVALAARGFSEEELIDVVQRHMAAWERPERGLVAIEQDIPRAVGSWERKQQKELARKLAAVGTPPPYGSTNVAVPHSDLFASVSAMTLVYHQTTWLIRYVLDHPSFVILFGDPGVGKSFVAIDWACCVALGRKWQDNRTLQGGVLYLAGEGFNGLAKRFLAWRIHNGVSDAEWSSAPLFVSRRAVDLLDAQAGAEMWDAVAALGMDAPKLIVIDTLSRMTPGMDENAAKEMSQFVQWCDKVRARFGCTIVVVHHSGIGDKGRVRGSTVLKGAADVEIGAMRAPGGVLKVFNSKMKEGEEFPDMFFKLTDVTLPWVIQPEEPGDVPRQEKSAVLMRELAPPPGETIGSSGAPSKNVQLLREALGGDVMTVPDARDAFCRIHPGADRKNQAKAFNKTLKGAVEAGLIIHDADNDTVSFRPLIGGNNHPNPP